MTNEERDREVAAAKAWNGLRWGPQRCAVCGIVKAKNANVTFYPDLTQWLCLVHYVAVLDLRDRLAGTDRPMRKAEAVPSTPLENVRFSWKRNKP